MRALLRAAQRKFYLKLDYRLFVLNRVVIAYLTWREMRLTIKRLEEKPC